MSNMHCNSKRRCWSSLLLAGWTLVGLGGCQGDRLQSSLHPAGPAADGVARLWWILFVVLAVYSLAVFVLTAIAIFRPSDPTKRLKHQGRFFILLGGVFLPALILVPLLIYSLTTTQSLRMRESGLTIRVVGHLWWWEVEYPDHRIITANELTIPAGEPVKLDLTSADVIHSFWVPQLHGKMDLIPGKTNEFWIQALRPGIYRGQCAEYCGQQHAHMGLEVHALPPADFVQWLSDHQQPISAPAESEPLDTEVTRGKQLFVQHGCGVCHAVKGTPAEGRAGPNLTFIATRRTLAAATLSNTRENLLAWIADPQSIKPGAKMPPTHASKEELQAIVAYLQQLDGKGGQRERRNES